MERSKCLCTGMLYNPDWEKSTKNGTIRKRSLMDVVQKLKPKNGFKKQKSEEVKKKEKLKSDRVSIF
jgi:hypothetical protein